jgi:ABC-2 type transport system permease protein
MTWRALRKYVGFLHIARREARRTRGETYGRVLFFGVILGVFSTLWRAVSESGMPLRARPEQLVWYLAVTEWIVLGVPAIHLDIENDVRRGDVIYRMARPISYLGSLLAEGAGRLSVRLPRLALLGLAFAWLFAGRGPDFSLALLYVIPLGIAAAFVLMTIYVLIGLLAFWLGETAPVYWVCQKLLFVLGGLMLPLDIYPAKVLTVAKLTPFPSLLYGPASLMLGGPQRPLAIAASLALWSVVLIGFAALLVRGARRKLELYGG